MLTVSDLVGFFSYIYVQCTYACTHVPMYKANFLVLLSQKTVTHITTYKYLSILVVFMQAFTPACDLMFFKLIISQ